VSIAAMTDLTGSSEQAYKQGIIANAQWKHIACPSKLGQSDAIYRPPPPPAERVEEVLATEDVAPLAAAYSAAPESETESAEQEATPEDTRYKCANADASTDNTATEETTDDTETASTDSTDEVAAQIESGSLRIAIGLASLISMLLF
jgi:hypothetical protein